jgi:serine/threonine-protein kinase RsbW
LTPAEQQSSTAVRGVPAAAAALLRAGDEASVTLRIPCAPEYVGTARLTILGVAGRMGYSYDQIEDIRLAVGEACTNAIDRAARDGGGTAGTSSLITITSHVEVSKLTIEIEDHVDRPADVPDIEARAGEVEGMNPQELGALLMEILVDEVSIEALPGGGTRVRLVKYTTDQQG